MVKKKNRSLDVFTSLTAHFMAVGNASLFPGLIQLFFQSHRLLFSHASEEVRGKNTPERKFASTESQTHNHLAMSPTPSPLSHSGRKKILTTV